MTRKKEWNCTNDVCQTIPRFCLFPAQKSSDSMSRNREKSNSGKVQPEQPNSTTLYINTIHQRWRERTNLLLIRTDKRRPRRKQVQLLPTRSFHHCSVTTIVAIIIITVIIDVMSIVATHIIPITERQAFKTTSIYIFFFKNSSTVS